MLSYVGYLRGLRSLWQMRCEVQKEFEFEVSIKLVRFGVYSKLSFLYGGLKKNRKQC